MFPEDLHYTETHEWARVEGDIVTVGITKYAVEQLKDLVYIELGRVGDELDLHVPLGVVESVKAASDLYPPVSGVITEVHDAVAEKTDIVAKDPYGEGWLVKIKMRDPSEVKDMLSAAEYEKHIKMS
ncbi:MAG: glycine cleavage system protein GcvH [Planctomycetota bacterium]